jgi:serine/threonine protein kinase
LYLSCQPGTAYEGIWYTHRILPESFATDGDRLARFEREAKTVASLNHPQIAQIYRFENSGKRPRRDGARRGWRPFATRGSHVAYSSDVTRRLEVFVTLLDGSRHAGVRKWRAARNVAGRWR